MTDAVALALHIGDALAATARAAAAVGTSPAGVAEAVEAAAAALAAVARPNFAGPGVLEEFNIEDVEAE